VIDKKLLHEEKQESVRLCVMHLILFSPAFLLPFFWQSL